MKFVSNFNTQVKDDFGEFPALVYDENKPEYSLPSYTDIAKKGNSVKKSISSNYSAML